MIVSLLKSSWHGEEDCVFCKEKLESVDHLFVVCDTVKMLLEDQLPNKKFIYNCSSANRLGDASSSKGGVLGRRELLTITSSWWSI